MDEKEEEEEEKGRRTWQLAWWGHNELLLSVWKGVSGKYCWFWGLSLTSLVKHKRDGEVSAAFDFNSSLEKCIKVTLI